MKYLLDSNAWIALLRRKNGPLLQKMKQHPEAEIVMCSVVLGELLYGVHHSGLTNIAANLSLVDELRARYVSLPFDDNAAEHYGRLRAHLARFGQPVGPNDLLIASIAVANGLTLITHNLSEFSRVPGLAIEDWQNT